MSSVPKSRATRKRAPAHTKRAPEAHEVAAMATARQRLVARPVRPAPLTSLVDGIALKIEAPHADEQGSSSQVQDALGTASTAFADKSLLGLAQAAGMTTEDMGHALAIIAAVKPADELESALAQQMVAVHLATLNMTTRAQKADTFDKLTAYGNLANKFARTFAGQVDALNRLRNGGAQVVRHINVYPGGQAVVADQFHHHTRGSGNVQSAEQSHARQPALPSPDPFGDAVPVAGCTGETSVPTPRRDEPRRANREPAGS